MEILLKNLLLKQIMQKLKLHYPQKPSNFFVSHTVFEYFDCAHPEAMISALPWFPCLCFREVLH